MRRDTIFYQLFLRFPQLLFELVPTKPVDADQYVFEAIEVKETSFRKDGEGEDAIMAAKEALVQGTNNRDIIEMVTTIMVYKFTQLTRAEVDEMLGVTLQETRVYQDALAEGKVIGEAQG